MGSRCFIIVEILHFCIHNAIIEILSTWNILHNVCAEIYFILYKKKKKRVIGLIMNILGDTQKYLTNFSEVLTDTGAGR